jgi:hypothetical protein
LIIAADIVLTYVPVLRIKLTPGRVTEMTLLLLLIVILFLLPALLATAFHFVRHRIVDWRNADRSSVGFLPPALPQTAAIVRIFSARTVRWRGIVATHSWIVLKEAGGRPLHSI